MTSTWTAVQLFSVCKLSVSRRRRRMVWIIGTSFRFEKPRARPSSRQRSSAKPRRFLPTHSKAALRSGWWTSCVGCLRRVSQNCGMSTSLEANRCWVHSKTLKSVLRRSSPRSRSLPLRSRSASAMSRERWRPDGNSSLRARKPLCWRIALLLTRRLKRTSKARSSAPTVLFRRCGEPHRYACRACPQDLGVDGLQLHLFPFLTVLGWRLKASPG
mmetsp:Transcript_123534/g.349244  ORF Transcript_123534/g.349244 Transcript_123534/m.349244 type:complete len:215 (-) Transcript_123534:167-811(-)